MATSYVHAQASARKFGGVPEDYIKIHEFIDSSKKIFGDVRHRSMFHHTAGPWICQEVFGHYIEITDGDGNVLLDKNNRPRRVVVREIAENHIIEDLGCIPSPADWINCMECKAWMGGKRNKLVSKEDLLGGSDVRSNENLSDK